MQSRYPSAIQSQIPDFLQTKLILNAQSRDSVFPELTQLVEEQR